MSNYLYKSNGVSVELSSSIKYFTNSAAATAYNLTYTNYSSQFQNITETPNTTNYKYQNSDLSTFSIASWIETTASTSISLPTWCNKIRAVLVGAGGGGGAGQNATTNTNQHTHTAAYSAITSYNQVQVAEQQTIHRHNSYNASLFNQEQFQQFDQRVPAYSYTTANYTQYPAVQTDSHSYTAGTAGGGGGGGGFIYLNELDVASNKSISIQVGTGGSASSAGNSTVLTINSSSTYTAPGGNGGQSTTSGSASATTTTGTINISGGSGSTGTGGKSGVTSQTTQYSNNTTIVALGSGGSGGSGGAAAGTYTTYGGNPPAAPSGSVGSSGTSGYCRLYYLTN